MGGNFCPLIVTSGLCPLEAYKIRPFFTGADFFYKGLSPGFGEKRLKSFFFELNSNKAVYFCPFDF